jgi:hypothetical protein
MEWTKLTVAVSDVGQAPKAENLAQSEVASVDGELTKEADTTIWGNTACFGDVADGSYYRKARIALDAIP